MIKTLLGTCILVLFIKTYGADKYRAIPSCYIGFGDIATPCVDNKDLPCYNVTEIGLVRKNKDGIYIRLKFVSPNGSGLKEEVISPFEFLREGRHWDGSSVDGKEEEELVRDFHKRFKD